MKTLNYFLVLIFITILNFQVIAETKLNYDVDFEEGTPGSILYNFFDDKVELFDKIYLEDTPINRIYQVRLLLNKPEYYKVGLDYLNQLIAGGGYSPSAERNLIDAARILRRYDFSSLSHTLDVIMGQSKILELRAFTVAQYFLNEAIMNSRILLNMSSHNEKGFMKLLLESYMFPLMGKHINIIWPSKDTYSFDKYKLIESVLTDVLMLNPSNRAKMTVLRGKSEFWSKVHSYILEKIAVFISEADFEELTEEDFTNITDDSLEKAGIIVRNIDEPLEADNNEEVVDTEKSFTGGIISATAGKLVLTPEQRKELVSLIFGVYKNYFLTDNIPLETFNDTKKYSMLAQIIADPGTVAVDPQLRAFAENIKVELVIGEEEPESLEILLNALKKLSKEDRLESCANLKDDNKAEFDLRCIYKRSNPKSKRYLNPKSIQKLVIGMEEKDGTFKSIVTGRPLVRFVTSIAGADLELMRTFFIGYRASLFKHAGTSVIHKVPLLFWQGTLNAAESTPGFFGFLARAIKNIGGFSAVPVINNLSKSFDKLTIMNAKLKNVVRAVFRKPLLDTSLSSLKKTRLERIFTKLAYLGIAVEAAALVSDMYLLDAKSEKLDSIARHLGNAASYGVYLTDYLGARVASWDLGANMMHMFGYENVPESRDIFAGIFSYALAWGHWQPNMTALKISEIEENLGIPLKPMTLSDLDKDFQLKKEARLEEVFADAASQAINATGRYITAIYTAHRKVNEYKVDKFISSSYGVRIDPYRKNYLDYLVSYRKTLKAAVKKYNK